MLIGFSHEKIGAAVVDHFAARGRRRLAAADRRRPSRAAPQGRLRAGGARARPRPRRARRAADAGRARAHDCGQAGAPGLLDLLARHPDVDAIFSAARTSSRFGVLIEAQLQGIAVPGRSRSFGFGDLALARDFHPALTTVRIDGTSIGRLAARFIVDRAEGQRGGAAHRRRRLLRRLPRQHLSPGGRCREGRLDTTV